MSRRLRRNHTPAFKAKVAGRQENGACAASRDCFFDPADLMSGNIVQKDDLTLLQGWSKNLLYVGQEVGFRQANLKLCKRTIRLFRYKVPNPIYMWLKRESLVPAELVWADTARFTLALDDFHTGMTGFDCRNDTFAQIVGIRLPHS
jgi:hypothetical protein